MDTNNTNLQIPNSRALIVFALLAFLGPNGLYLYTLFTQPELNAAALGNPVALAFMIEAMMLLGLFLWFVYTRTQSIKQVMIYLGLSFLGSLAFSFPLFLYFQKRNGSNQDRR
jgi:hypothetical protein